MGLEVTSFTFSPVACLEGHDGKAHPFSAQGNIYSGAVFEGRGLGAGLVKFRVQIRYGGSKSGVDLTCQAAELSLAVILSPARWGIPVKYHVMSGQTRQVTVHLRLRDVDVPHWTHF